MWELSKPLYEWKVKQVHTKADITGNLQYLLELKPGYSLNLHYYALVSLCHNLLIIGARFSDLRFSLQVDSVDFFEEIIEYNYVHMPVTYVKENEVKVLYNAYKAQVDVFITRHILMCVVMCVAIYTAKKEILSWQPQKSF